MMRDLADLSVTVMESLYVGSSFFVVLTTVICCDSLVSYYTTVIYGIIFQVTFSPDGVVPWYTTPFSTNIIQNVRAPFRIV